VKNISLSGPFRVALHHGWRDWTLMRYPSRSPPPPPSTPPSFLVLPAPWLSRYAEGGHRERGRTSSGGRVAVVQSTRCDGRCVSNSRVRTGISWRSWMSWTGLVCLSRVSLNLVDLIFLSLEKTHALRVIWYRTYVVRVRSPFPWRLWCDWDFLDWLDNHACVWLIILTAFGVFFSSDEWMGAGGCDLDWWWSDQSVWNACGLTFFMRACDLTRSCDMILWSLAIECDLIYFLARNVCRVWLVVGRGVFLRRTPLTCGEDLRARSAYVACRYVNYYYVLSDVCCLRTCRCKYIFDGVFTATTCSIRI